MKFIVFLALSLFLNDLLAQTDCKPYVPITEGSKWEITTYTDNGKENGKAAYELIEKTETDSGTVYTIKSVIYDKKGNVVFDDNFQAFCVNGNYKVDMAFRMNGMGMPKDEDMEMDIKSSNLEFPSMQASVGSTLKDGHLTVNAMSASMPVFTMTVLISERKIEARESKTTPAGTFDCLVLAQKISTKMFMNMESFSKEWYASEIGMIRSESYNKNGKLESYSELTKLEIH